MQPHMNSKDITYLTFQQNIKENTTGAVILKYEFMALHFFANFWTSWSYWSSQQKLARFVVLNFCGVLPERGVP